MSYDRIPDEAKKLDRWVCWRWEEKTKSDGTPTKPAKVPINPNTGGRAMSNNSSTWGTFVRALDMLNGNIEPWVVSAAGKVEGIGFFFSGDGLLGVDIDGCINDDGVMSEEATDIIQTLESYTEKSQSGKGVHILCRGKLPDGRRRKGPVEMYEIERYFIMTGDAILNGWEDIEERTDALAIVHSKYLADEKPTPKKPTTYVKSNFVDERTVMERMEKSRKWGRLRALMEGDFTGFTSASEAELSLMNDLYYYCDADSSVMESIFKKSGLYQRPEHVKNPHKFRKTLSTALNSSFGRTYSGDIAILKEENAKDKINNVRNNEQNDNAIPLELPDKKKYTDTDLGRSKIFSAKYKNTLRWYGNIKSWMIWNGKVWERDEISQTMQMAKEIVEEIMKDAAREVKVATGEDQLKIAKAKLKESIKAQSERSIRAIVELAKSDLPIRSEDIDKDSFLLNCQNGVVDLRTGQLMPHNYEFFMTKICEANYNPSKKFEKFGEFLRDICCEDAELAEYFKVICGMAAVGKVFHEGMCMFNGTGQNGKSTFVNTIIKVFGSYAGSISPEILMHQKDGKSPTGLADVKGKRFVAAIETDEGKSLSAVVLKQLASTDAITARRLYENNVTFDPTHTLILATNHLPKVGSIDNGTWRRIAIVPFKAVFTGRKEIKGYASILHSVDADAILSWIVQGAMKYISNDYKMQMPEAVKEATAEYRNAENWVSNFVAERCEVGDFEEKSTDMYDAYCAWCSKTGNYKRKPSDFKSAFELSGYTSQRKTKGIVWVGIRVVEEATGYGWKVFKSGRKDDDGLDRQTRMNM